MHSVTRVVTPRFLKQKPGRKHEDRHVRQRRACGVQLRRNRLNLEVRRCSVLARSRGNHQN